MIFKTEINPRDYDGYYGMIAHLQTTCLRKYGAGFDTTKIAMGQLTHNSEICWFEGYVDDALIARNKTIDQCTAREYIENNIVSGCLSHKDVIAVLEFDRAG